MVRAGDADIAAAGIGAAMDILLDTNILIDFFADREPFCIDARKLLLVGAAGEVSLWTGQSQVTDIYYVLTSGAGKLTGEECRESLGRLFGFVKTCSLSHEEMKMALRSSWTDFEDACVYQTAQRIKADVIITRDKNGFSKSSIPVMDASEFFTWLEKTRGISYSDISSSFSSGI